MEPLTITLVEMDDNEMQTMRILNALFQDMEAHKVKRILTYWVSRADEESNVSV